MLLEFSFSNFRSFRHDVHFSTIADEKYGAERDFLLPIPGIVEEKALPVVAIYGGNAAGKTNFVQALSCLRRLVLKGNLKGVEAFRLDKQLRNTDFSIYLASEGKVYRFTLCVNKDTVVAEKLEILENSELMSIYERTVTCGVRLTRRYLPDISDEVYDYVTQQWGRLPASQILLHHAIVMRDSMLNDLLQPVYDWFRYTLTIIRPESRRLTLGAELQHTPELFTEVMEAADTGIEGIRFVDVPLESAGIPSEKIELFLQNDDANAIVSSKDPALVVVKEDGKAAAKYCCILHYMEDGTPQIFPLSTESDGTMRYMNLVPTLLETRKGEHPHVYIIDELDRSLHYLLSRRYIEQHLELARQGRETQLIFTTHDLMLMDAKLLPKDALWAAERNRRHESAMISFNDFVEYENDTDIRESYLAGRMGGIPQFS